MIVCLLRGRRSPPRPGWTGRDHTQSLKQISDCVKHVEAMGGVLIFWCGHRNGRRFETGSVQDRQSVDRTLSTLNWTSVKYPSSGPTHPVSVSVVLTQCSSRG